ncbi:MAG: hypothetical protein FWF45_02515 [Coriobacteriia bacterium]|nr:hypothetical protein [Coriobacteriia bacterium]
MAEGKKKAPLVRLIIPALLAGILYGLLFFLRGFFFFDKGLWMTITLFCAGAVAVLMFGAVSKSIGVTILRGFLFGFIAMIILHLMLWVFNDAGSFGDVFSWGLMYSIVFSIAGILLGAIGYGAKRLFSLFQKQR